MFADKIEEVESIIDKLPECSPQHQPLEKLLVIWEVYDTLEEQCERLLKQRQHQIQAVERSPHVFSEQHALNEYLYGELETSYPVLTGLAATVERINSNQTVQAASETADRPRTC